MDNIGYNSQNCLNGSQTGFGKLVNDLGMVGHMITPEQCRAARAILEMSQQKLAEASGVSVTTIKDFELGKREPKAYVLQVLATTLTDRRVMLIDDELQTGVAIAKDGARK